MRIEKHGSSAFDGYCSRRSYSRSEAERRQNISYGMFYRLRKPYKMEECLFDHLYAPRVPEIYGETVVFDSDGGKSAILDYDLTQFYTGKTTMQASLEWYDDIYLARKDHKLIKRDWLSYMLGNLGVGLK